MEDAEKTLTGIDLKPASLSIMSSSSGRGNLTRSTSDTKGISVDFSKMSGTLQSTDDNDAEPTGMKQAAISLSSSNSLPNLSKYDIAPDVSSWVDDIDIDFPFELYDEDIQIKNEGDKGQTTKKRQGSSSNTKRKVHQTEAPATGAGMQDKTQFFSREQISHRADGIPPTAVSGTERKSQSTTSGSGSNKMDTSSDLSLRNSSSASVDTRDTMAELARRIEPVDRDGVEFAPLDDLHLNLSSSYSMSLDENMALDSSMNQSMDKKLLLENPESFSMSSWSQHTISQDLFAVKSDVFSRDGLFTRRAASDQSITEQMLNDEEAPDWNSASLDLDLLDSHDHTGQVAATATATTSSSKSGRRSHGGSANSSNNNMNGNGSGTKAGGANRGNRPPLIARNAKLNAQQKEFIGQVASRSNDSDIPVMYAPQNEAIPPPPPLLSMPSPDAFAQQYSFPSTYSVSRGNSSQPGSPSSTSSAGHSSVDGSGTSGSNPSPYPYNPPISAMYDPSTGIVYYPHIPPGAMGVPMPMGAQMQGGPGGVPARLVPLGQHNEASVPVHQGFVPMRADGARTPEFGLDDGSRPGIVRKLSGSNAVYDNSISATVMHGSSNSSAQAKKDKKDKNRGNYRCGRCGKPKVNHVCAFVDTTTVSQAVQAKGPILDPNTMQPFPTDRVLTVNPKRKSIQDREDMYENLGMIGDGSRSGSLRFSLSRSNSGVTADSLMRSASTIHSEMLQRSASTAQSDLLQRSASSVQSDTLQRSGSSVQSETLLCRSNSGSDAIFPAFSRSGDELLDPNPLSPHPLSPSSAGRLTVGFSQPISQTSVQKEQIQQHLMNSESNDGDDVFFPTAFPPGGGGLVFSSRNSSVNSTYGNESDTSSTCGDNANQRSTLGSLLSSATNVDLGLSKFFRFGSSS